MNRLDIKKGDRYGRVSIIKEEILHIQPSGQVVRKFLCKCDCGIKFITSLSRLERNNTRSCGCLKKEGNNKSHGMHHTRTYRIWASMKDRCTNSNTPIFKYYGDRGITISPAWMTFKTFLEDMGVSPNKMTLERINNNRGYFKENCKWATRKEQARNRRSNRLINFRGETKPAIVWTEELGISYPMVRNRLFKGWDPIRALTTPIMKNQYK